MADKEKFPIKRPGDSLSAAHVNALSEIAQRTQGSLSGTFMTGIKGPVNALAAPPYFVKNILLVLGVESGKIYRVKPRYYDHQLEMWRTNAEVNTAFMDATDVGATYEKGDKAVAYWCEQRAMYIPMLGVDAEPVDPMWCGQTCFWVQECCVYRGTVRRIHQSPNYCELIEESQPAWIVHSPFFDEALMPGDEGYLVPQPQLPPNATGWVRKISDSHECTYFYPVMGEQIELTEDLPVFEWCLVQPRVCPLETQIVTIRFSFNYNPELFNDEGKACREACKERLRGIGSIELKWQSWEELMEVPLQNLPDCSQVQELYEFGAWVGEFEVPTSQPVRLFPVTYKVRIGTGSTAEVESEIGWVRLEWCTGELLQLYRNDNGDHIPETREWWDLVIEPGCYSPSNSDGTEWREDIQYEYRLIFACLPDTDVKHLCVEHIHPACHIWAGEALNDAGRGENMHRICMNSYTCEFDSDFGTAPMRGGPVGYFYNGGPSQFNNHRFAGCCNSMDQYCEMLSSGLKIRAVITW